MDYTDVNKWHENVNLLDEQERVLGGLNGPTNRPTKQLSDRTAWLKYQQRTVINTDLVLQVSPLGNDSTGDYTGKPFRQPQSALNYAISKLDFQYPAILTLQLAVGSYSRLDIRCVPQGVLMLKILGENSDTTLVSYVVSHAPCEVELSNIGINNISPTLNNAMIIAYTGATIILTGNVSFFPQKDCSPVIAHNCGHVYVQNCNFVLRPGATYYAIFTASGGGNVRVGSSSIMVDVGITVSNALVYSTLAGIFIAENMLMSNVVTGKRYTADSGGGIFSNSTADTWPCSQPGTKDGTAIVI